MTSFQPASGTGWNWWSRHDETTGRASAPITNAIGHPPTRIRKPASNLPARPENRVREDPNENTMRISAKPSLPMPSYRSRYTIGPSESRKKCGLIYEFSSQAIAGEKPVVRATVSRANPLQQIELRESSRADVHPRNGHL